MRVVIPLIHIIDKDNNTIANVHVQKNEVIIELTRPISDKELVEINTIISRLQLKEYNTYD